MYRTFKNASDDIQSLSHSTATLTCCVHCFTGRLFVGIHPWISSRDAKRTQSDQCRAERGNLLAPLFGPIEEDDEVMDLRDLHLLFFQYRFQMALLNKRVANPRLKANLRDSDS